MTHRQRVPSSDPDRRSGGNGDDGGTGPLPSGGMVAGGDKYERQSTGAKWYSRDRRQNIESDILGNLACDDRCDDVSGEGDFSEWSVIL